MRGRKLAAFSGGRDDMPDCGPGPPKPIRPAWLPIVLTSSLAGLYFVPLEELVLLPASALRALEAADNKHGHSHRHQNGEHCSICPEPCQQAVHITFDANAQFSAMSRRPLPNSNLIRLWSPILSHPPFIWLSTSVFCPKTQILAQKVLAIKRIKGENIASSRAD